MSGEQARDQSAQQDGQEGASLQQGIAAHQLVGIQYLRQQTVLGGREERRMHAHQK